MDKHYHHPPDRHWILPSLVIFLVLYMAAYVVTPAVCNTKEKKHIEDTVRFLGPVQFQCTYCGRYNEQNIYIKPK